MNIAILTSPDQWFVPYAKMLCEQISGSELFFHHQDITESFDTVFILSYHKIIPQQFLEKHRHNIVVHASALPQGKGWAPLFWQVLEGKNKIPFTLFEATEQMDNGDIYFQDTLVLTGYELNDELRDKQAKHTLAMCHTFINTYELMKKTPQTGVESQYPKRTKNDSRLDIDQSIREQFNLLRIVNNTEYPAFFEINGHRYILKIEEE